MASSATGTSPTWLVCSPAGQVTESARALRRTRGRLRELCRVAELQLQLLDSSGEATAASDLRPLPHSRRGWRRDGAPRGATELDALASCPNFVALQIQLLARINSSRRENRWNMSPDVYTALMGL